MSFVSKKILGFFLRSVAVAVCLCAVLRFHLVEASYLPTVGSNIGIGTSTPVGAFTILSGNVGIGTWSPTQSLQVVGTITAASFTGDGSGLNNLVATTGGGWTDGGAIMYQATTTDAVAIGTTTPSTTLEIVKQGSNAPLMISASATGDGNLLIVNPDGNIGIGTTAPVAGMSVMNGNVGIGTWSPTQMLQVVGTLSATYFVGDGSGLSGLSAGGWVDGGTNIYSSPTTDNVGIGTTTPTVKLLVDGDAQLGIDASTPTSRTLKAADGLGGNKDGANLTIASGRSTGTGTGGSLILQTTDTGGAGSSLNTSTTRMTIDNKGNIGIGTSALVGGLVIMNGNVGIGTWSPVTPLDLGGGVVGQRLLVWNNSGNRKGFGNDMSGQSWEFNLFGAANGSSGHLSFGFTTSGASYSEKMRLTEQGNVGIGTTLQQAGLSVMSGNVGIGTWSPIQKLQVIGTVNATYFVGDGSGLTGISAGGWVDGGTNVYVSPTTDNVGIGTTTPASKLTIAGNIGIGTYLAYRTIAGPNNGMIVEGNVGIGTWNPVANLDVSGIAAGGVPLLRIASSEAANRAIFRIYTSSLGKSWDISVSPSTGEFAITDSQASVTPFTIYAGGGNAGALTIAANGGVGLGTILPTDGLAVLSGNVGIGTWSSPANRLHVVGNIGIGTTLPYRRIAAPNDGMVVEGNVGIGTWNPLLKLQVVGTVSATSFVGDGSGLTNLPASGGWVDGGTNIYASPTTDNVGIGTTTPTAALLVENAGTQDSFRVNDAVLDSSPFFIDPAGNVGMGTTTADAKLRLSGGDIMLDSTKSLTATTINGTNYVVPNDGTDVKMQIGTGGALTLTDGGGNVRVQIGVSTPTYFNIANVGIGTIAPVGALTVMSGNVGIGTWSPTQKLQVVGTVSATSFVGDGSGLTGISAGGWVDGGTNVYVSPTTDNVGIGTTTPTAALLVENAGTQDSFRVNDAALDGSPFIINPAGNAGIGTTTPGAKLNVLAAEDYSAIFSASDANNSRIIVNGTNSGASSYISFQRAGSTIWSLGREVTTEYLSFSQSSDFSATKMVLTDTANVGIGTTNPRGGLVVMSGNAGIGTWSPQAKLQVVGSVLATSFVGDGSGLTGISAGSVGWTDGGTNVYISTTTDNVGIGTTTPSSTIEIVKTAAATAPLMVSATATGDGDYLKVGSDGNVGIGTTLSAGGLSVMNGNVGIGTWSPRAKLQVVGSVLATSFVGDGSGLTGVTGGSVSYWQKTLLPGSAVLDDGSPPSVTVVESTGTGTPRFEVADFDASTDEIVYWTFAVPTDMAAGSWLLDILWFGNSTTANADAIWAAQISCTSESDADTPAEQAAATANTAAENVNATEANRLVFTTLTLSNTDSVAASDVCTLRFFRDADDSVGDADNDGLSVDARLISVNLRIPRS